MLINVSHVLSTFEAPTLDPMIVVYVPLIAWRRKPTHPTSPTCSRQVGRQAGRMWTTHNTITAEPAYESALCMQWSMYVSPTHSSRPSCSRESTWLDVLLLPRNNVCHGSLFCFCDVDCSSFKSCNPCTKVPHTPLLWGRLRIFSNRRISPPLLRVILGLFFVIQLCAR